MDLERKHRIYKDNVSRVKGAFCPDERQLVHGSHPHTWTITSGELTALTKMNKLKLHDTWSPSNHTDGAVPWMHTGSKTKVRKEYPERYGAPGDGSRAEETFTPRLTNTPTARVFVLHALEVLIRVCKQD